MLAKRNVFSWINIFFGDCSNEVSHAHGQGREVRFAEDPVRDPDRENGHYENIYIDYVIDSILGA